MRTMSADSDTERIKCKQISGQVVLEYVIVLAVTLMLIFALIILLRTISEHGERSVDRVGYAVP